MMLRGILLGFVFSLAAICLFYRSLLATLPQHSGPMVVSLKPFAVSYFVGVAIGIGIVALPILGLFLYWQHQAAVAYANALPK